MAAAGGVRRYWRVLVIGILGGALAFASSYLISPVYQSSTRLIIHGQDANFLYASGQSDPSKATITDATQATSLADTYGSIATSRSIAIRVVNDLHLAAPRHRSGFVHTLADAAATAYRCTRAFVTSGFCASPSRYEQAVDSVQSGTTALQLGTTAGATAGDPGSYVLEISASGDSPAQARAVTNAVAKELVATSARQVRSNAQAYVRKLQGQLTVLTDQVTAKTAQITAYERDHHVSAADQQTVVAATSSDQQQSNLRGARADLSEAQAQLASIQLALASTPQTTGSDQQVRTGRSSTTVTTSQANPAYTDLLSQQAQLEATVNGLQAKVQTLQGQVDAESPIALNGRLAQLANLQDELTTEQQSQASVSTQLQQAQTQLATASPALGRLDTAGEPQYPVSPARYLYLLIGLLLGALIGGALTWLAARRPGPPPNASADAGATGDMAETEVDDARGLAMFGAAGPTLVPVGATVGRNGKGAGGNGAAGPTSNGTHPRGRAESGPADAGSGDSGLGTAAGRDL